MKRKICFAMLTLTASLMMVFAAPPAPAPKAPASKAATDACTEKYNKDVEVCKNAEANCKARGSTPENCASRHQQCMSEAEKAKKACEAKK